MLPEINSVLFDLDGTLADTAPDLAMALNQLLKEYGKPPLPFAVIRPTVSHGAIAMLCMAFKISKQAPELQHLRERFLEIYSDCLCNETRLFPGIPGVLERLEFDNINWGVVTNKSTNLTIPLMRNLGLAQRAACVVSGDTLEHRKPHPAPMLLACQLIKCKASQTLYIGDAKHDVIAGHNAGMYTLIAAYGYIAEKETPDTWGADGIINSPSEILDWLGNVNVN